MKATLDLPVNLLKEEKIEFRQTLYAMEENVGWKV